MKTASTAPSACRGPRHRQDGEGERDGDERIADGGRGAAEEEQPELRLRQGARASLSALAPRERRPYLSAAFSTLASCICPCRRNVEPRGLGRRSATTSSSGCTGVTRRRVPVRAAAPALSARRRGRDADDVRPRLRRARRGSSVRNPKSVAADDRAQRMPAGTSGRRPAGSSRSSSTRRRSRRRTDEDASDGRRDPRRARRARRSTSARRSSCASSRIGPTPRSPRCSAFRSPPSRRCSSARAARCESSSRANVACADAERLLSKQIDGELVTGRDAAGFARTSRACASCSTLERRQRGRRAALRRLGGAITLPSSLGSFGGGGGGVVAGGVTAAVGAKAAAVVIAALTVTGVGVGVGDAQRGRPAGTASGGAVVRVDAPGRVSARGRRPSDRGAKAGAVASSFSPAEPPRAGRAADAAGTRERGRPAPASAFDLHRPGLSREPSRRSGAPVSAQAEAGAAAGSTVASAATTARLPEAQAATAPRPSATSAHDPGRTTRALPSTPSVSAAVPTATVPSVTVPSVTVRPSVNVPSVAVPSVTAPSLPTPA